VFEFRLIMVCFFKKKGRLFSSNLFAARFGGINQWIRNGNQFEVDGSRPIFNGVHPDGITYNPVDPEDFDYVPGSYPIGFQVPAQEYYQRKTEMKAIKQNGESNGEQNGEPDGEQGQEKSNEESEEKSNEDEEVEEKSGNSQSGKSLKFEFVAPDDSASEQEEPPLGSKSAKAELKKLYQIHKERRDQLAAAEPIFSVENGYPTGIVIKHNNYNPWDARPWGQVIAVREPPRILTRIADTLLKNRLNDENKQMKKNKSEGNKFAEMSALDRRIAEMRAEKKMERKPYEEQLKFVKEQSMREEHERKESELKKKKSAEPLSLQRDYSLPNATVPDVFFGPAIGHMLSHDPAFDLPERTVAVS
jgi:hypothetical protein